VSAEERDGSLGFLQLANIHKYFGERPRIFRIVTEKEIVRGDLQLASYDVAVFR
jgi:hypothetical protein